MVLYYFKQILRGFVFIAAVNRLRYYQFIFRIDIVLVDYKINAEVIKVHRQDVGVRI